MCSHETLGTCSISMPFIPNSQTLEIKKFERLVQNWNAIIRIYKFLVFRNAHVQVRALFQSPETLCIHYVYDAESRAHSGVEQSHFNYSHTCRWRSSYVLYNSRTEHIRSLVVGLHICVLILLSFFITVSTVHVYNVLNYYLNKYLGILIIKINNHDLHS